MWMDFERMFGNDLGAGLKGCELIGAAYLLILILFSIRVFNF